MNNIIDFFRRFGFILFVAVMFLTLICAVAFGQPVTHEGLKMIEREQPKKGLELLNKSASAQPTAINFFFLGCGFIETGNTGEALSAFEKGIAVDPKVALNHVGKGRVLLRQGNVQAAMSNFEKATDLTRSKNTDVLTAIGEAWLDKPEFIGRAKEYLERAEALSPNAQTSLALGDAFLVESNGGKAISNYEYAATLDVRNPAPYHKIGLVYIRSTSKDAALEAFRKAVSIDPGYTSAYKELGELNYNMKNGPEAVKAQEKYMELTESPDAGLVRLGYYLFMTRDFARTNEVFEQASKKGLLKGTAVRYYALSLSESGDYSASQRIFDEYFATASPQQVEASDYTAYGRVLLKQEQDSLAVIAFQKSLQIDDKQLPVKQLVAETLFKLKRYDQAIDAYKNLVAAKTRPTSQDLYSLGRSYYFTDRFQQADTTFNQLINMQPGMTIGYLWAGRANAQLDPESDKGLAKPYYDKVIEIGQATPEKSKSELKEAYSYLGYYYFIKNEGMKSRSNWEKVLALDPQDDRAKEALKVIKQ